MLGRTIERLKTLAARLAPEFSWTNYTKQDKKGELPVHGAARLTWQDGRTSLRLEWNLLSRFVHVGAEVNPMESEAKVFAAIPPVAAWLTFSSWPVLHKLLKQTKEREISLSYDEGSIRWRLWSNPNHWSSKTPRWRDGSFNFADALLGEAKTARETVDVREVEIPMSEGVYLGRSTIERVVHKRPRWFAERFTTAQITMDPREDERFFPIPHPGKGENSYDCHEDALYSSSCRASTHAEAIGGVVASVMCRRMRYGGDRWRPEGGQFGSKAGGGGPGGSDDDPPKEFNPETDPAVQAAREKLRRAMRPAPEETDDDPQAASSMPSDGEPLATAMGGALDAWARFYGVKRNDEDDEQLRARTEIAREYAENLKKGRAERAPTLRESLAYDAGARAIVEHATKNPRFTVN